jgi:hypothetical protein
MTNIRYVTGLARRQYCHAFTKSFSSFMEMPGEENMPMYREPRSRFLH